MKEKRPADACELADEQLGGVSGGQRYVERAGKRYRYVGDRSNEDLGKCYLCPKCGRPLRYNSWLHFCCDSCDDSWYFEDGLTVNLADGAWEEAPGE